MVCVPIMLDLECSLGFFHLLESRVSSYLSAICVGKCGLYHRNLFSERFLSRRTDGRKAGTIVSAEPSIAWEE